MLQAPVAFFVFNRPQQTRRVFAEIRKAQPTRLLVVADGPRSDAERELCEEVRAIATAMDWPGELLVHFSPTNLGCGKRVSSGLDWVFNQVEEAIILEDDCLPDQSFFRFCKEMLDRYRDNAQVMHIAGTSEQEGNAHFHPRESYYFSRIANIWGWATWRRAWQHYDFDMQPWPTLKATGEVSAWMQHPAAYERFDRVWDQYYRHDIDSWDGQWNFTCLANHGLCINPSVNLVSNIGFDRLGTHTKKDAARANIARKTMHFPLMHPTSLEPNVAADAYKYKYIWSIDTRLIDRILRPLKTYAPWAYRALKQLDRKS